MKLLCLWRRREFAHYLETGNPPLGTPLAHHLARCHGCRASWEELRGLSASLPGVITVSAASGTFIQTMWKRIEEAEGPGRAETQNWGYAVPMVAITLLALVAWVTLLPPRVSYSRGGHSQTSPKTAELPISDRAGKALPEAGRNALARTRQPRTVVRVAASDVPRTETTAETIRERGDHLQVSRRAYHRHRLYHRGWSGGGGLMEAVASRPSRVASIIHISHPAHSNALMVQVASSERYDDGSRARVTNEREYFQSANPNVTFTAGRVAEDNGDTERALECYVSALQADAGARAVQTRPERG